MTSQELEDGALGVIVKHNGQDLSGDVYYVNGEYRVKVNNVDVFRLSPNFAQGTFQEATFAYIAATQDYALTSVNRND